MKDWFANGKNRVFLNCQYHSGRTQISIPFLAFMHARYLHMLRFVADVPMTVERVQQYAQTRPEDLVYNP